MLSHFSQSFPLFGWLVGFSFVTSSKNDVDSKKRFYLQSMVVHLLVHLFPDDETYPLAPICLFSCSSFRYSLKNDNDSKSALYFAKEKIKSKVYTHVQIIQRFLSKERYE